MGWRECEPYSPVEIDDEHLVLGMTCANKCESGAYDILTFVHHPVAVINNEADGCRRVFGLEDLDLLFAPIFINAEVFFSETRHGPAVLVEDGDIKHYEIDINR